MADMSGLTINVDSEHERTTLRIRVNPLDRGNVNPLDRGKLIGKQGRTARSIRTNPAAAAMKTGQRFSVDIVEDRSAEIHNGSGAHGGSDRCDFVYTGSIDMRWDTNRRHASRSIVAVSGGGLFLWAILRGR